MDIETILKQKHVKLVQLVVPHVQIRLQYALYVSLHTSLGMIMLATLLVQSLSLPTHHQTIVIPVLHHVILVQTQHSVLLAQMAHSLELMVFVMLLVWLVSSKILQLILVNHALLSVLLV